MEAKPPPTVGLKVHCPPKCPQATLLVVFAQGPNKSLCNSNLQLVLAQGPILVMQGTDSDQGPSHFKPKFSKPKPYEPQPELKPM